MPIFRTKGYGMGLSFGATTRAGLPFLLDEVGGQRNPYWVFWTNVYSTMSQWSTNLCPMNIALGLQLRRFHCHLVRPLCLQPILSQSWVPLVTSIAIESKEEST
jgi:hypothetical protein